MACNLAVATAASGRNVLLVDGDSLNPSLHEVFALPNDRGFSDFLAMPAIGVGEAAMGAVWLTEISGLYVLPSGSAVAKLPALLGNGRAGALFDRLRPEFDLIVIDAAPVLSTGEARNLGRGADATVLVTRAGQTAPDLMDAAVQQLIENDVRLLGTIHNVS